MYQYFKFQKKIHGHKIMTIVPGWYTMLNDKDEYYRIKISDLRTNRSLNKYELYLKSSYRSDWRRLEGITEQHYLEHILPYFEKITQEEFELLITFIPNNDQNTYA